METIINKAGIQPIPTLRYSITTSDVVKYLQNQLTFGVAADFTRWTGISPDLSYVRMRVVLAPSDIVADTGSKDYVDRILAANAAGIMFKSTAIDTLKPFMYPANVGEVKKNIDDLNRLYQLGVFDDRLDEIINYSKLNYCKEANVFRIFLRPERIIADMLADPSTGKIDGEMSIIAVQGTSSETIRWEVAVTKNHNTFANNMMSVDSIFSRV